MSEHRALIAYIQNDLWALKGDVLDRAVEVFNRQLIGEKLDPEEIQAIAAGKAAAREFAVMRGTAIIPITGVIAKGAGMVNNVSQPRGTAVESVRAQLRSALSDDEVERIMLHVDSPGGSVSGVADLAGEIRAAAGKKPVTAFIEDMGASAAFWLASQASLVFANKTGAVGSIGVFAVVVDSSKAAEARGLKFHVIRSGPLKGAGGVGDEITDDQLASFQERIDDVFGEFVDDVAAGRDLARDKVLAVADGSVFTGRRAKRAKLVDAITDFDGALKRTAKLTGGARRPVRSQEQEPIMAQTDAQKAAEAEEALAAKNRQDDAIEAARKEGATDALEADRKRTAGILSAVGDFPAIAEKAISGGLSVDAAKALAFDAAVEQRDERQKRLDAIANSGTGPAPSAKDEETPDEPDPDNPTDDGKASTYQARYEQIRREDKQTVSRAHAQAAAELPRSFAAWNAAEGDRVRGTGRQAGRHARN